METPLAKGTRVEIIRNSKQGRIKEAVGPSLPESDAPGTYGYFVELDEFKGATSFFAGSSIRALGATAAAAPAT